MNCLFCHQALKPILYVSGHGRDQIQWRNLKCHNCDVEFYQLNNSSTEIDALVMTRKLNDKIFSISVHYKKNRFEIRFDGKKILSGDGDLNITPSNVYEKVSLLILFS
jgi:hypothetical protein